MIVLFFVLKAQFFISMLYILIDEDKANHYWNKNKKGEL